MRAFTDMFLRSDFAGLMGSPSMVVERIDEVQQQLREDGVDGWMLYDFRGSNPTASQALGLEGLMVTRRIMYYIPARGVPTMLCHSVDVSNLPTLPGRQEPYIGWRDMNRKLARVLDGARKVAMEYFPEGAIPYLSRVDAGTVGWLEQMGVEVVPSADLVQYFLCRFTEDQAEAHRAVALELDRIKDEAFAAVAQWLDAGRRVNEYQIQQLIMEQFSQAEIVTDHPPIVAAGYHTADAHYLPSADASGRVVPGDLLMIVLWGHHDRPVCAYADITWMAHVGDRPGAREREMFDLVVQARDAGLSFVRQHYEARKRNGLRGWEVDRAVRDVIEARGLGDCFPHRTGHNIGALAGHGDGTHIDDLETHDTRPLIRGLCFSLEPGIYLEEFGVRTGIDVLLGAEPEVASPMQRELVLIPARE